MWSRSPTPSRSPSAGVNCRPGPNGEVGPAREYPDAAFCLVRDLPLATLTVTEYQMMRRTCGCGHVTIASPPPGVTGGPAYYGPGVTAAATLLASTDVIGIEPDGT